MPLISPASNDAVARRRNDGSYSMGVAGAAFDSTVSIARPDNTTNYTAGDVIGVAKSGTPADAGSAIHTLSNAGPSGGFVLIQSVSLVVGLSVVTSGMGGFRVHFYNASPTAILDNAAYNLVSDDVSAYMGFVDLAAPQDLGSTLYTQADYLGKLIKLAAASTSLYAQIETRNGFTPASGATYELRVNALEAGL